MRFGYTSRVGARSQRRVEPYRQVLLGRRWYLLGWDLDRRDWRTFRLDRISALTVPGTTFAPRERRYLTAADSWEWLSITLAGRRAVHRGKPA